MDTPVATSLQLIRDGVFTWQAFSPHHKVELTSSAIVVNGDLYVFDPIPLTEELMQSLEVQGCPKAVILTNENHLRNSEGFARRWKIPVVASDAARVDGVPMVPIRSGQSMCDSFQVIELGGGAGGELAFIQHEKRVVILGDALFNLPTHGFDILPERYCTSRPRLISHLRDLAKLDFDLLLMAHGQPIGDDPAGRIKELLERVAA